MNIKRMMGLNDTEYETIKNAAKTELPFKVTIRIHRQVNCYGAIDIRPVAKNRQRAWSDAEVMAVIEFVKRHNLDTTMNYLSSVNAVYIYRSGIEYLRNIV